MSDVVLFEEVSKRFGDVRALDNVTFRMSENINFLLGPNGSGKSTAINLMAGLVRRDSGNILILGRDPHDIYKIIRKVGFLLEKYWFYESLTGYEHIVLAAKLKGIERPEAVAREAVEMVALGEYAEKPITGYSKGNLQKLALAHAFLGNPELVILDEPFANLDPPSSKHLVRVINELSRGGVKFVISTHVLSYIEELRGHVVMLDKGRVIYEGDMRDILNKIRGIIVVKGRPLDTLASILESAGFKYIILDDKIVVKTSNITELSKILKMAKDLESFELKRGIIELEELFRLGGATWFSK